MAKTNNLPALTRQLTALHRELGISASYGVERRLTPFFEAAEDHLVEVGISEEGRPIRLTRPAAESWGLMRRAAMRSDVELVALSGFRSIARQTEIFRGKLAAGQNVSEILRFVAAPGFSEHHTGRALDLGTTEYTELDEEFAETVAFHWLEQHASNFGFTLSYPRDNPHGIAYEPWHWCWSETLRIY
jgi:D-alanyl-D-alanine carboxypeptidase